jgi:hypothetical protein
VKKKRYPRTPKQRQFMQAFENNTNYAFIDDETEPFGERARRQLRWFQQHSESSFQRLKKHLAEIEEGA